MGFDQLNDLTKYDYGRWLAKHRANIWLKYITLDKEMLYNTDLSTLRDIYGSNKNSYTVGLLNDLNLFKHAINITEIKDKYEFTPKYNIDILLQYNAFCTIKYVCDHMVKYKSHLMYEQIQLYYTNDAFLRLAVASIINNYPDYQHINKYINYRNILDVNYTLAQFKLIIKIIPKCKLKNHIFTLIVKNKLQLKIRAHKTLNIRGLKSSRPKRYAKNF